MADYQSGQVSIHARSIRLLLTLLFFVLVGAVAGSMLGLFIGILFSGVTDPRQILDIVENQGDNTTLLLITQGFASVGMFILPPLALGLFDKRNALEYFERRGSVSPILFVLAFLITLSFGPVTEWLGMLNEQLSLPASLSGLEQWMQSMEAQMEEMTIKLLSDTSPSGFLINLLVIAVIAAVGEELLFRGCLQRIFQDWFGNPHLAIWVVAILFSAIHLQFYGFLPRLALGAVFGYLFFWSGNLWLPIFAHFINNAAVLVSTYIYQKQGHSLTEMDMAAMELPFYADVIGLIVCVLAVIAFWHKTKGTDTIQLGADPNN